MALTVVGCAADEADSDDWDNSLDVGEISVPGRWLPSAAAGAAGDRQSVRYDDAPSWSGGRNCGGSLHPGTRELGEYLRTSFRGVRSFEGYACRPNTANTSQTSIHGTGRAVDVFIPTLAGGAADNTVGDALANWLIANSAAIGVQLVIWDRTIWSGSRAAGTKQRAYGGPHPHNDHLHIELTIDGAARRTGWFRDRSAAPAATPPAATPPAATPPAATPPAATPPAATPPAATPPAATPPAATPAPLVLRINAGGLNLRTGPSASHPVITAMSCGANVTVVGGPTAGWYNVRYGSTLGWASGTYLRPEGSFDPAICR